MSAHEVNFDGIVGPTHNYAGLSYGNVASMANARRASNPKQAALQGLAKMKLLGELGVKQAVLPPQERPHLPTLRRVGYGGSDADVLAKVAAEDPLLLSAACSASAMWTANAATVSPSADSADGRVHFTPANLISNLHRSIETGTTARVLSAIFADERHFAHHEPLPAAAVFSDEGAANHTRLCADYGSSGIELFTFGQKSDRFPARQSQQASRAIARLHQLSPQRTFFVRQSAAAIDAGAFHNDVVAVGNRDLLLYHERAWDDGGQCIASIRNVLAELRAVQVNEAELPLAEAIATYLFNSQLVTLADGSDAIIAPMESKENDRARAVLSRITHNVHFLDLRQSMRNGGGPACLRLRVVVNDAELAAMHRGVILSDDLHDRLIAWVNRHYRDHLVFEDLADPKLLDEFRRGLDELTQILGLARIYEFQR